MLRKGFLKNIIKDNKKIFSSLLLVISIGVGLYVGLESTFIDMKSAINKYYNKNNLFDIKVSSTIGFTNSDKYILKGLDNVEGVSLSKTLDAQTTINNKDYTIKLNSISKDRNIKSKDYMNRLTLVQGRYPSTLNEGLVDEVFFKNLNLSLGDLINLKLENNNYLKAKKIKIVGVIKSNSYHSNEKEDNSTNYFMYLEENSFNLSYYTECYIKLKDSDKYDTYSKKYEDYINRKRNEITKLIETNSVDTYKYKKEQLQYEIASLQDDLNRLNQTDLPVESLGDSIKDISDKLKEKENELSKLENLNINSITKLEFSDFKNYKLEAEKVKGVSKVFSLLFLTISILISLTIITSMLEAKQKEIGLFLSIGYSKITILFRYLFFGILVSVLGSAIGILLFFKTLPLLIGVFHNSSYNIPIISTSLQIKPMLTSFILTCVSLTLVSVLTVRKNIKKTPADLINQRFIRLKKKEFFEKIKNALLKSKFLNKVSFKNIFTYKKRILVTTIIICILISLILTSFGINDSSKEAESTLDFVIILIVSAWLLLIVALNNLTKINMSERKKEIASLKTLGYYNKEIIMYINKDILVLNILGTFIGLVFGSLLTYFIVKANINMFNFKISILSYILTIATGTLNLCIVYIFTNNELRKLNIIKIVKQ